MKPIVECALCGYRLGEEYKEGYDIIPLSKPKIVCDMCQRKIVKMYLWKKGVID